MVEKKQKNETRKVNDDNKWTLKKSPYFLANYGQIMTAGGVYPAHTFHTIFFAAFTSAHVCFLLYTALLTLENEFANFVEAVHFACLLTICLVGLVVFQAYKQNLSKFCYLNDQGIQDYGDSLDPKSLSQMAAFEKESLQRKLFRSNFMKFGLFAATCMLAIVRPTFEYMTGKYADVKFDDGVVRQLPIACWVPYDTTTTGGYMIGVISEYYFLIQVPPLAIGTCVFFLRGSEQLCYELSVLQTSLENLPQRVEHLLKERGTNNTVDSLTKECLQRSVKHHQTIIECFDLLNTLYNFLIFIIIFGGSLMICLSGFMFAEDSVDIGAKISSLFFLTLEMFHILVYCWYGEELQGKTGSVGYALYKSNWIDTSIMVKHHMLIMEIRSYKPLKVRASFFAEANLETFSNVLSTAYSYFNLLRASIE